MFIWIEFLYLRLKCTIRQSSHIIYFVSLSCPYALSLGMTLAKRIFYISLKQKCSNLNPISPKLSSERGMVEFSDINEN